MSFVDSDQKIPVPAQSTDRQKGDELVLKKKKKKSHIWKQFPETICKAKAQNELSFPLKVQNTEKLACKPKANSCLHAVPSCSCSHCLSGQHRQE